MTRSAQHTDCRIITFRGVILSNPQVLAAPVLSRLLAFDPGPCEVIPLDRPLPLLDGRAE